jgi:hypothetical protein
MRIWLGHVLALLSTLHRSSKCPHKIRIQAIGCVLE